MTDWWEYDYLEPAPEGGYDWAPATKGDHPDDQIDFHLDLGAGVLKKGRLTLDRFGDVDILQDLNTLDRAWSPIGELDYPPDSYPDAPQKALPFPDNSIKSIISHHCLEHIGDGFIRLMDECYRVLEPGGKFRIIVPLFPSFAAVDDPDHKRYFTKETFISFCHEAGPETPFWTESFSVPYTNCRFHMTQFDYTKAREFPSHEVLSIDKLFEQGREIRTTLTKPEN